jgi:hypothetical protein
MTYSSNNYQSPDYGVGYAWSLDPTGPFTKSSSNPILSQDPSRNIFSTGHGSILSSSSNKNELYYPHHFRPSSDPSADRYLYTSRLFLDPDTLFMGFGSEGGDLKIASGVAPCSISTNGSRDVNVEVKSASGATFDLSSALNRLRVLVDGVDQNVTATNGTLDLSSLQGSKATIRYQRARSNQTEPWSDVLQWKGFSGVKQFVEVNVTLSETKV